jgi:arsenate reductase
MSVSIYHNPRCSKSRQTLALIEEQGHTPVIIEYLKNPPSAETFASILKMLALSPRELMRTQEAEFKAAGLDDMSLSDDEVISKMLANPKLIERPIVIVDDTKAIVGRPPENVLTIL